MWIDEPLQDFMSISANSPSQPLFLFAHGAGAGSSHPWMRHWAELLRNLGIVHTFDYPYMKEGGRRPDPLPKLILAHREAMEEARRSHPGPVVLIGKSMGSRVGCHLALTEAVSAVICLGYPLCGAGDSTKLRDRVLRELATPILFIQGTRDKLCPLDLLQTVREAMTAANALHVVEEGDHSLAVTKTWLKAHGKSQDDIDREILGAIRGLLRTRASGR